MARKEKIIVVLQGNVGGAERVSVSITKGLSAEKYNLVYYLVGMENNGNFPLAEFIPSKWPVIKLKKRHPLFLMLSFLCMLLKERPQIVFSSTFFISGKILLLRKLFPNTRFVVRCENYLYTFKKNQLKRMRIAYKNADLVIAQTEEMANGLLERLNLENNRVVVLHNPIDTKTIDEKTKECRSPYPENGLLHICACGRIIYQKGFDLLLEAFVKVKEKYPKVELYIVGKNDGTYSNYYEELIHKAERLGIIQSVTFTGYQNNPYLYLQYADCFVLSSRWEGMPNVILESLYLGTPVAAFKCIPIIERIITEGVDGCLAEKENVQSLSEAIIRSFLLGRVKPTFKTNKVEDFHTVLMELC